MRTDREKVMVIVDILKKRFPNLTVVELINLSWDIFEAVEGRRG